MSDLLTIAEVAARLRRSPATIRRWIAEGDVPFVRIKRQLYVPSSAIGINAPPVEGPPEWLRLLRALFPAGRRFKAADILAHKDAGPLLELLGNPGPTSLGHFLAKVERKTDGIWRAWHGAVAEYRLDAPVETPALLTVQEAAERARCSTRTIRRWIKDGTLQGAVRVKRRLLVPPEALDALYQPIGEHHDNDTEG